MEEGQAGGKVGLVVGLASCAGRCLFGSFVHLTVTHGRCLAFFFSSSTGCVHTYLVPGRLIQENTQNLEWDKRQQCHGRRRGSRAFSPQ